MRTVLILSILTLFVGCASNTLENPNLQSPVDPAQAEVVGSKITGDGGIPHQIWVRSVDGVALRNTAIDQTLKIWPISPGPHELGVSYSGSTGKVFIKPFVAEGKVSADLKAGHRYMIRVRRAGESSVAFVLEDASNNAVMATSAPVQLIGIVVPIFVPAL